MEKLAMTATGSEMRMVKIMTDGDDYGLLQMLEMGRVSGDYASVMGDVEEIMSQYINMTIRLHDFDVDGQRTVSAKPFWGYELL
jgi:hypothetical protein